MYRKVSIGLVGIISVVLVWMIALMICMAVQGKAAVALKAFRHHCDGFKVDANRYALALNGPEHFEWRLNSGIEKKRHEPVMIGVMVTRFGDTEVYTDLDGTK